MMRSAAMNRRDFVKAAGLGFLATLAPKSLMALERADAVYASGIRAADGSFAVATVTERGEVIDQVKLPARAHGMAFSAATGRTVAFARRPGTYAMIFDPRNKAEPIVISSREDRHFYGHGAFSADGRLLYASENDFDGNRGMIGLYDATDRFTRIGEFETYGIGPHDMTVSDDGRLLIVANGGIETHPDFGRTKLNLGEMQPSLVLIDAATGALVEKHVLPAEWAELSTRHIDLDDRGRIWFACQYEGHRKDLPPLVGHFTKGEDLTFIDLPEQTTRRLANYVGAIAVNRSEGLVGITSPKGGASVTLDARTGKVLAETSIPDAAGIAPAKSGFAVSSYDGDFLSTRSDVAWDQHIVRI
ncbi:MULTISPECIES: DUF1513 domain-containing protein [unclassified Rhizobium]|uniref:DUF1513 domain-containing protein n=1 Tax=unclassified Rhizobium TaxID=2613769 RepID=UPI001A9939BA|nr:MULTISPECIES: DUF1513 domain-containing protein [unclassified Rhizobium]MBX5156231.1 DUF1513 domain-containing protein [Rhizobium sp. NZLR8]MBX5165780.1 DUF1513 domain-containing protein [Rhizobium sp. NZLR4b]MBX5172137.1 DUF1513 domain-containing protein [Rhizobium sp. NZLR1b]MBX5205148.1 DUF1513 domain-containing protein [Rhizobium sp. NZLR1]MBX5209205.1 DUF1513 domain-containing protein [Rhizobium sp. NZLR11]